MPATTTLTLQNMLQVAPVGTSVKIDTGYGRSVSGIVSISHIDANGEGQFAIPGWGARISAPGTRHGGKFSLNVQVAG